MFQSRFLFWLTRPAKNDLEYGTPQETALEMATGISIYVIQDTALLRAGLTSLITQKSDLLLVGEAGSVQAALQAVRKLKPHIVIMDVRSLTINELDAPNAVREASKNSRILMLIDNDESEVFAALSSEAEGYCLREAEFERIYAAIHTVASGEFWLDSAIARKVVKALLDTMAILAAEPSDRPEGLEREELSTRELEVLALVSQGMSNLRIAERLSISAETVKSHIRHIMKKLVVNDRTQAAVKALKRGLI